MSEKEEKIDQKIFYDEADKEVSVDIEKIEEQNEILFNSLDQISNEPSEEDVNAEISESDKQQTIEQQQPEYEIIYQDNPDVTAEYQMKDISSSSADTVKVEKQGNKLMKDGKIVRRKRKDKLGFNWFFWISFAILMIPVIWFGNNLLQAYLAGDKPVIGKRITDNVTYVIYPSDVEAVASGVNGLSGVESAECTLTVQTLRITVNANDSLTNEEFKALAEKIYEIVDQKISISKYFTRVDDYTQYDLEIKIYDSLENEKTRVVILYKNANMEGSVFQDYTTAIDPELKAQIYKEQNLDENGNPLPEPEQKDEPETDEPQGEPEE